MLSMGQLMVHGNCRDDDDDDEDDEETTGSGCFQKDTVFGVLLWCSSSFLESTFPPFLLEIC